MRSWLLCGSLVACSGKDSGLDDTAPRTPTTTTTTTSDTTGEPVDPSTVPLHGRCPMATDYGGFSFDSDALLSVVGGAVADGVIPISIMEEVGAEGGCVLLRTNNPFCDPPCAAEETCDFDGECLPFPIEQDLGTVTVEGLTESVEMEPSPPGYSYYALGLSHPPYAPGDLVTLRTTGGAVDPFTLYGVGLDPLDAVEGVWTIYAATDLPITWASPSDGARSTVSVRINIDQHGTTPVQLQCDFEDTGQATIPAALLDELIGFGVTGIPSATFTRSTMDSVEVGGGCVDFSVAWTERPEVDVDGFTPCQSQDDCPKGEVCNKALEICE